MVFEKMNVSLLNKKIEKEASFSHFFQIRTFGDHSRQATNPFFHNFQNGPVYIKKKSGAYFILF